MAWDDSEFVSPDYSLYTGPSDYSFDPSFTDFYGGSSYLPAEMDYQSVGYENPTFNLYDQLAQSGIISQDMYGAPDLSALYTMDPSMAADIGAGATFDPGQMVTTSASFPVESALQGLVATNPEAASDIRRLGEGTYDVNGQLMDRVQVQDYIDSLSRPQAQSTRFGLGSLMDALPVSASQIRPSQSYRDQNGGIVGLSPEDGVQNPYEYRSSEAGDTYIQDIRNGMPIGWVDEQSQPQFYQNERIANNVANGDPTNTGALMKLLSSMQAGAGGAKATTSTSGNKNSTLPLQQRNSEGKLTNAQTGLNAAAMATMIAEALRNKSVKAAPGTMDSRGADAWTVGRAAGSGRKKKNMATGGLAAYAGRGHVSDPYASGGQADTVHAALSGGEYVMDADVVSALGDGDTGAGAAKLDRMRQEIRKHKRSAPAGKIPPKAKSPLEYMKGAK